MLNKTAKVDKLTLGLGAATALGLGALSIPVIRQHKYLKARKALYKEFEAKRLPRVYELEAQAKNQEHMNKLVATDSQLFKMRSEYLQNRDKLVQSHQKTGEKTASLRQLGFQKQADTAGAIFDSDRYQHSLFSNKEKLRAYEDYLKVKSQEPKTSWGKTLAGHGVLGGIMGAIPGAMLSLKARSPIPLVIGTTLGTGVGAAFGVGAKLNDDYRIALAKEILASPNKSARLKLELVDALKEQTYSDIQDDEEIREEVRKTNKYVYGD